MSSKLLTKRFYIVLWICCIIGSWAVFPYIYFLNILPSSIPLGKLFILITTQAAILYGIVCWLIYLLIPKTDLRPFSHAKVLSRIVYPALLCGMLVGLIIFVLDKTVFHNSIVTNIHPPLWSGALASIYGAINEEVLLRLFLFTLIYFLLIKSFKKTGKYRSLLLWVTTVIVAIIFGLGHLPVAFRMSSPSGFEIFRIFLLNAIPEIVFGWLYWTRGFFAPVLAHFVADLLIHVILI